ncbi:hypothetical protein [Microbacterium sp. 16-032]|uniref:hypothetical protein n=1 Tax=Microbacterium sp. 16-032 TaxID=3239808 RepID=UPI0034E26BD4
MSESGVIVALIGLASAVLVALIAVWRFWRKDRADADAVEEGTISGRFKDADTLMQYIDQRVDERTRKLAEDQAATAGELEKVKRQYAELAEAVRTVISLQWVWDQRGRHGDLPMLPDPILYQLGLGHLTEGWATEPTSHPKSEPSS